jgi:hypothetical protein
MRIVLIQLFHSLSIVVFAAFISGCRSEPTKMAIAADLTDRAVFAELFASHPALGATGVLTLEPAISDTLRPEEGLPVELRFDRKDLHSATTLAGLNLIVATNRQLAFAYRGSVFTDLHHLRAFQHRFPGRNSIIRLSHTYVREETAAIYVQEYCGGLCGISSVFLFERSENGWRFVRTIEISIS